ncbi:MAG: hypothetical protein NVS9B12_05910 [Vulcanimicrobiaceae bacterium]
MLAYYDYHDIKPTTSELNVMSGGMLNHSIFPEDQKKKTENAAGDAFNAHRSDTDLAALAASDFQQRIPDISNDEALASNHVVGATSGC